MRRDLGNFRLCHRGPKSHTFSFFDLAWQGRDLVWQGRALGCQRRASWCPGRALGLQRGLLVNLSF